MTKHLRVVKLTTIIVIITLIVTRMGCIKKEDRELKKIIIRWAGYSAPDYDPFRRNKSKEFENLHPNVEVRYEPIVTNFRGKILAQIAANIAPDIFFADDLLTYINKGVLLDLTEFVKKDREFFERIHKSLIDAHEVSGKIYALPGNCGVSGILYYNKAIFDREGVSYPDETWTWEDLLQAAKKLTRRDSSGKIVQFGYVRGHLSGGVLFHVYQDGGRLWNKKKDKCIINTSRNQEILNFWRAFYTEHHVSPTPSEVEIVHRTSLAARDMFIMGRAAMYGGNSWDIRVFTYKGMKDWEAALFPIPEKGKERYSALAYLSLGIWSGSKNPKMAYEFAKFTITPDWIKSLVEIGDSLPLRDEGPAMEAFLEKRGISEQTKEVLLKTLRFSQPYYREYSNPKIPYMQLEQILVQELERFELGIVSAQQVLGDIQRKLNKAIREENYK